MGRRRRRQREPTEAVARVDSLDQEGRGVARVDGKVTFIDGALPGEEVRIRVYRSRRRFDEADTLAVLQPSGERVRPLCPHADPCGGCSLQHLSHDGQIHHKQADLMAKLLPWSWGYRRKARLGCKHVPGKGGVLVGFRERRAHLIADIGECHVLVPEVGMRIRALRDLLSAMDACDAIPQIEMAAGDDAVVLVLRNLHPLQAADLERLRAFARQHSLCLALQPGGPDSVVALEPAELPVLSYRLPLFDLTLEFEPLDFVQVNGAINESLVERAVNALDPQPGEAVLDLFCGLGNFSLALARRGAAVTGIEMGEAMVARASANAARNGLPAARFHTADLASADEAVRWVGQGASKLLLDPPRTGAEAVALAVEGAAPWRRPARIVYVSCNPATLARDAGVLVNAAGYRLAEISVVDMFPHTNHLESMAVFEREP